MYGTTKVMCMKRIKREGMGGKGRSEGGTPHVLKNNFDSVYH